MSKELSRKQILDQIKLIMTDGRIRTGREIANASGDTLTDGSNRIFQLMS